MKLAIPRRRWTWIILGAGAYALHLALGKDSISVENIYSRGFFSALRRLWDHTLGLSPVALLYVFLAAVVLWDVWKIFKILSRKTPRPPSSTSAKIGRGLLFIASWAGIFIFFFYVLWGFNYNRVGIEKQLSLNVQPLDLAAVKAEAEEATTVLVEARASIPGSTTVALDPSVLSARLESSIRGSMSKILRDAGYPAPGRPRVRPLRPGGLLMIFSSTGFYFPYLGESYIAGNLTPAEKPFVMSHEMVHAYGITDEGAANFLGFLACESSAEPVIRYSGFLSYWSSAISELARFSRDEAAGLAARLPEGVKADIRAAREKWDKYRGPLRTASQAVYDRYLKSQGIREGLRSYDRFVSLVVAWKSRLGNPRFRES
jgi:hypothetical protein